LSITLSPQTHVARGATYIFLQGVLTSGLGVLYVWFLLHTKELTGQILFTEADMGLLTMVSFLLSLTSLLGIIALRSASIRFLAQYLAEEKVDEARSVITRVLQVSLVTSSVIVIVLLVFAKELSLFLASPLTVFLLLPISSVLSIFYTQAQGFLQGLQKFRDFAALSLLYSVVHYSIAVFLVYAGFGILGVAISWFLTLILICFVSLIIVFRSLKPSRHTHALKPLLEFSFPIFISVLLTFIVGWVDQIFILPFLGLEALGVYNLAVRASSVPNLVSTALTTSLFPKLTELHSRFGSETLSGAFKTSTRYAALLGFPISLLVAVLAYPIVVLFATARFVEAVVPLAIMCVASLPTILGSAITPAFYTLKRTRLASAIMAISIIFEALLSFILLAYFNVGLDGVALSRLLATITVFVLGVYFLRPLIKVEFDKEVLWKSAAASGVMVLSIFLLEAVRFQIEFSSYNFLVLHLRQLPMYAIVGGCVYFLSLILLKALKREDINLLRDYLPSRFKWVIKFLERLVIKDNIQSQN
jgi:O-antigen/teichoic acid export membrane protein